mgnify:CR=1 FL=1
MELAITDDHAAQDRVWSSTPCYNRNLRGLRRLLLGREIDAATDPLAKFVGIPAHEAAGGVVVRDLFEDAGSGYITVSYTHLRAHKTALDLVCRLLLHKKKQKHKTIPITTTRNTRPSTTNKPSCT